MTSSTCSRRSAMKRFNSSLALRYRLGALKIFPDLPPQGAIRGLTGKDDFQPPLPKGGCQKPRLGGFAAAVYPFQGQKNPALCHGRPLPHFGEGGVIVEVLHFFLVLEFHLGHLIQESLDLPRGLECWPGPDKSGRPPPPASRR